jgi:hypothetical protein
MGTLGTGEILSVEKKIASLSDSFSALTKDRARLPGKEPRAVLAQVEQIVLFIFEQFDFAPLHRVFFDILKLFQGKYPGYRRCNTLYHDLNHTMECLLVTAQLLHGAQLNGVGFTKVDVELELISALMHDTGYLQAVGDNTGTGGKYTLCHISRSIDFMGNYFSEKGFPAEYLSRCSNFLKCTGIDVRIADIKFPSRQDEILGKILGTADLVGQMAGDDYLRKLPHLYAEFKEGGVLGFEDEMDLIRKTPAFWEMVKMRFAGELGQVNFYLRDHFRVCCGVDRDLHREAIERNMARLRQFMQLSKITIQGIWEASLSWA